MHQLLEYVRQSPYDCLFYLAVPAVLRGVLMSRVTLPEVGRPVQLFIAAALMVLGAWMFTRSSIELPKADCTSDEASPNLSKNGPLGLCRHPQYSGLISLCLSVCVYSRSADRLAWTLVLILLLDKKADLEEAKLSKTHPDYAPCACCSGPITSKRYIHVSQPVCCPACADMLQVPKLIPDIHLPLRRPLSKPSIVSSEIRALIENEDGTSPPCSPLSSPSRQPTRLADLPDAGCEAVQMLRTRGLSMN